MRFSHVTYCDDVRQELFGKVTFVGIYNGALGTPEFPCVLAKLCIIVQLVTPKDKPFNHISLTGRFEGSEVFTMQLPKEDLEKFNAETETMEADSKLSSIQATAILSPMHIPSPGKLELEVVADGEAIYCSGLKIFAGDIQSS